jgi:pyruvate-ferredoxin/flavodoxin oxidoreductase
VDAKGHGPAWASSLFEDNAEFGYGIALSYRQRREKLAELVQGVMEHPLCEEAMKAACKGWLDNMDDAEGSKAAAAKLEATLSSAPPCPGTPQFEEILGMKDLFVKKSVWIVGGDGWAYDIGFGGLDHVIATGEDVNILVLDTEVYSNTGGQSSKATPTGSVAKFAAAGKRTRKKDLGLIAMSYGYVYVASVNLGANPNQVIKAMQEAEAYHGPSVLICYAPCINHGIDMSQTQEVIKNAVAAGYWPLYRYNPLLASQGKNPLIIDSKEPTGDYQAFLRNEGRYKTLLQQFPEQAEALFKDSESEAKQRLAVYKKLAAE